MMGYGNFDGYGYGYCSNGFGHIFGFVIAILAIIFLVSLIKRSRKAGQRGFGLWENGSAIELLKERYVKGEIDRTEFEQKKKDLMN